MDSPAVVIRYLDDPATAQRLVAGFRKAGIPDATAVKAPPAPATMGAPAVVITIVTTALAKAAIEAGIHAVREYLEAKREPTDPAQLQVVLDYGEKKRQFPVDLRSLTDDLIEKFVTDLLSSVV